MMIYRCFVTHLPFQRSCTCFELFLVFSWISWGNDSVLQSSLSSIHNVDLDLESSWLQGSLLISAGGRGVRRAIHLAPSAYLASAAGCSELITQILPPTILVILYPSIEEGVSFWSEGHQHSSPASPISHQQRAWDAPKIEVTINMLLERAPDRQTIACLFCSLKFGIRCVAQCLSHCSSRFTNGRCCQDSSRSSSQSTPLSAPFMF